MIWEPTKFLKGINPINKKMNSLKLFTVIACLIVADVLITGFISTPKTFNGADPGKGFAVVELFTSEGCSSCPAADELVARVQKESIGRPVYILAFHVDYWNRLGWKDVFSSPEYSARQNQYAEWLNLSSVYTPQIVVNGHLEFVGSEEGNLRNAIRAGLQRAPGAEMTLADMKIDGTVASVKYHAEGVQNNAALLIALVQKNAVTKVQRGENGGRTLSHVQIVRQFQRISIKNNDEGIANVALPHGFNSQDWEVIGFIQNTNGEIAVAAKAEFSSATDPAR